MATEIHDLAIPVNIKIRCICAECHGTLVATIANYDNRLTDAPMKYPNCEIEIEACQNCLDKAGDE